MCQGVYKSSGIWRLQSVLCLHSPPPSKKDSFLFFPLKFEKCIHYIWSIYHTLALALSQHQPQYLFHWIYLRVLQIYRSVCFATFACPRDATGLPVGLPLLLLLMHCRAWKCWRGENFTPPTRITMTRRGDGGSWLQPWVHASAAGVRKLRTRPRLGNLPKASLLRLRWWLGSQLRCLVQQGLKWAWLMFFYFFY